MLDFLANLFNTSDFPPRWHCGVWTPGHGWLHIVSDLGVWSAYYAIPVILIYVAFRRRDVPFRSMFWLFGAFILACGTTHLLEAVIFWWPIYRFAGVIKLITAIVSWGTVIALVPIIPQALQLRSPRQLEAEVNLRTAELAHANHALAQSEERLRLALDAGRMGTWDWDVQTNEVVWSTVSEAIHGLPPGGFPGTFEAFRELVHPEDLDRVLQTTSESVEQCRNHRVEYRTIWPDGSTHWVEGRGRLVCDDAGKPLQMIGVAMEITERKRTEQTLRFLADSSRALSSLVDYRSTLQKVARLAVPTFADSCGVHLAGEDGLLRLVAVAHRDPAKGQLVEELARETPPGTDPGMGAMHVFRTGRSELVEKMPDAMLQQAASDREQLRTFRQIAPKSYLCVPLVVRERTIGTLSFFYAESGRRYSSADLAVAEDLAHRAATALENARLYAQVRDADRRKDEFLAMLAHELRNPLAPIRSGLDLLAMSGAEPETVQLMQEQVTHVVRLVDDLLDVSRIMRGKIPLHKETVPLVLVVQRSVESVRPLMASRKHDLHVSLSSEPIWVEADPVRLTQVITNLLNNAAKFMEKGGRVDVAVHQEGDQAVVSVRDRGIGIDPELLPHVFDLFTQADRSLDRTQGGLGIGLTLVRSLVEMHGGTVEARSDGDGTGSEFVVRLPVAPRPVETPKPPPRTWSAVGRRILIVEDNVGAAKVLARLLAKTGPHEIQVANDGAEGLERARAFHPELVLLDIGLPEIDGYEVARRLRQMPEGDRPLIVALTGYGQEEDRRRSKEAGFDEHLLKPPSLDVLQTLFGHPKLAGNE